ncbi:glutathione S-transferase [Daldinia bambusicola]|nr:glutathione S-transferase [Daldinia bambusicola]
MSLNVPRSLALQRINIHSVRPFISRSLAIHHIQRPSCHSNSTHRRAPFSTSIRLYKPDDNMAEQPEPTGLIAKSGIELLTFTTPNGLKISILLEELKEAYGKDYTYQSVNIMKGTQKQPWFTAINPNGRIPAIVDHDRGGFAVFEGMAILSYLTRHYDPEHKFSFPVDSDDYSVCEQWMAWQHGGVGPMQGQANHFFRFAAEKIPYAVQRYIGETERLYGVLDKRLEGRDFIVGAGKGKYSIADMNLLGWVNTAQFTGVDTSPFPNIEGWIERCMARPAVKRGYEIPAYVPIANADIRKKRAEDPEAKKQHEESQQFLREAKEKYGYKYSSP